MTRLRRHGGALPGLARWKTAARPALGLGLAVLMLAPGCARGGASQAPSRDTAVVVFAQEPETLNPYLSPMAVVGTTAAAFHSGLLLLDPQGHWLPDLAEQVPTLENGGVRPVGAGMHVTYRLRRGVRWHDGKPFTSRDVQATWRLLMNPDFPAISRAGFEQIQQVVPLDAHTVRLEFRRPYAPYAELFPFVLPAHQLASASRDLARQRWNREPIGTGPYRFAGWRTGDRILAEANPDYFRGKPAVARLDLRFIPQEATSYQLWRTGEVDLLQGAPPTAFDALQREAAERVHVSHSGSWEHLVFNLSRPVLADRRVRQAIAHLIDRQQLNARAYGGLMQPAWSELPPSHWAFDPQAVNAYPHDPRAAAALLDAAGWRVGPDGIRRRGAARLSLTLLTTADKPARSLAAQIWRKQWQAAGIELTLEKWPPSVLLGSPHGRLVDGTFDLALLASMSRPDPDTSFRWRSDQIPPLGQNRARYRNARVDALLDAGLRTLRQRERAAIYREVARHLRLDLPVIPLLYWSGTDATSTRLRGFRPNPTIRGNLWNVWEWKLEAP
ncbi:MAG: peptide ABC transporter substrate-binding protein [Candidatus Sericytochromatia bacterium]|nr:peptide ABC transporter substrate-binding protein [Candidatus Sericytochromatia bacterium]